MTELWKSVPSLEVVMASSFGRLLFPPRTAGMPNGGARHYKSLETFGCERKSRKDAAHKYMGVYYKHYGNVKVHQAVCKAFHGVKPFLDAVVIHIDEDATNNRPDNLKWGTQKDNLNMPKIKKYHRSRTGENNPKIKGQRKMAA